MVWKMGRKHHGINIRILRKECSTLSGAVEKLTKIRAKMYPWYW